MISSDEISWLQANYPDLYFDAGQRCISGELSFRMFYSEQLGDGYIVNPDESFEGQDGTLIEDVYEIDIRLNDSKALPEVREVGGRIVKSLLEWNIEDPSDLHIHPNGALCLCVETEIEKNLPNGFNLRDFFWNLLIPFFFYQSYFERFGREPWPGYGHGDIGVLESFQNRVKLDNHLSYTTIHSYLESLSKQTRMRIHENVEAKGHHRCLCGSKKIIRKCHKKAMYGYNSLRLQIHAKTEKYI